jgi:hypothetical protein
MLPDCFRKKGGDMRLRWWLMALAAWPAAAVAQEGPRFCPNRPSLEGSACTTEPGRVHLEASAIDWELDRDGDQRTDTFLPGDVLVRLGVAAATELQFEWSPVGIVRQRDGEGVRRRTRTGDIRLAVRHAFAGADGEGLSYGIEPFVTLPVGRTPVGAGDWGAGVVLPLTYDVRDGVTLGLTGEVDAAVNEEGQGRHLAGSLTGGVALDVTDTLTGTLEAQWLRDDDPTGASTQWLAGAGLTWTVAPTRALYFEALHGLTRDTPDWRLYAGVAALF